MRLAVDRKVDASTTRCIMASAHVVRASGKIPIVASGAITLLLFEQDWEKGAAESMNDNMKTNLEPMRSSLEIARDIPMVHMRTYMAQLGP